MKIFLVAQQSIHNKINISCSMKGSIIKYLVEFGSCRTATRVKIDDKDKVCLLSASIARRPVIRSIDTNLKFMVETT